MTIKTVVFGATGYAGGLVTEALLRRGVRPVLAAHEKDLLPELAERLGGLDYQLADVTDPDSVRALVDAGDILITTVGPFERLGYTTAQAAADAGAHYIDSTGEIGFVRELQRRHHRRAVETDSVMMSAFGYDYVPGMLAGALAAREAGDAAHSLDIGYFVDGSLRGGRGLSQGTRKTVADGITLPVTVWKDGRLMDERPASRVRSFELAGKARKGALASGTEVVYLPELFPTLESISVYNGWFHEIAPLLPAVTRIAGAAIEIPLGKRLMDSVKARTAGPIGGPDADERARTRTHVVAVARGASGKVVSEVHVEGPSIYTLTGELIAWAGDQLLRGNAESAGVTGPVQAFGLERLVSGCAEIGLRQT